MSRITTYAIKEISSSFLFLLVLLSGILWMAQSLRHLDLLTSENVSFISYLSYIVLLLPKILTLTIPICIFLSILANLNRLRNDSELIILGASGQSDSKALIKPILYFSTMVYFILLLMSLVITPVSLNELRYKIIDIRSSGIHSSLLQEKKFISPVDTLTIFLQERNGSMISGLLIHDLKEKNRPQTYIAQKGEFISENNMKILRLYNGNIQIYEKKENKISEIDFKTYDLNLTPYNKQESKHIYSDELYTSTIMSNLKGKSIDIFNKYEMEQFAELHTRIIDPFYIFCYALLPLLVVKFARRPDDGWTIPIIIITSIAFSIQILQIALSNLFIEDSKLITINYLIPILILSIIFILIFFDKINIYGHNAK